MKNQYVCAFRNAKSYSNLKHVIILTGITKFILTGVTNYMCK